MKTQWRTMFFVCCLAFMLLPITAMSAELPDNAASGLAASLEASDKTEGGDYQNATDYFVYGNSEFFCNYDDEDKLYVLDKSTGDERVAMDEHIISLVTYRDNLYAIAYREGSAYLIRMNLNSLACGEYEPFSDIVTSMARRGNTIYFATDDGIASLNLDTHKKTVFLATNRVTMLYFSDFNSLKYYTEDGLENIYSFSRNAIISENNPNDQATLLGGSYTPRLTPPAKDDPYYTTWNIYYRCGYGMPNCTCYAFGRSYESIGSEPSLSHRDAGLWYGDNKSYPCNNNALNPALGAVTVWSKDGGAGHVAVVEVIDGNTVVTSESGYRSYYFKTVPRDKTDHNLSAGSLYHFLGYIYVCGESPAPPNYTVPGRYRVTASVGLHMRSGAGTGNQSLGVIPNGAELNVTQKSDSGGYTWGYASYDGKDGWVALNYCEYVGEIPASNGTLDINWMLDGNQVWGEQGHGTVDVYINGSLVADDAPDYCAQWPVGTSYEIKDIKPKDGYSYNGIHSGSRSGTIGGGTVEVWFNFSGIQTGGMTQAGETTFNGNTYRYYSNEVTWYTAKRFCEEQGGHLSTIASAEENERVKSIITANAWIGANDVAQEGTWTWVTGEPFSYQNWASGEPNNVQLDADNQNHMQVYVDGTWDDDAGCVSKPFVCEIEGTHLDVNGYLDGNDDGGLGDYGTVDVYINGSLVADDVPDYYLRWPSGTSYEIKDIKPKDGYSYNGIRSGSRSGTIGNETADVRFDFSRIQTGGMTQAGETTFNGNLYRYYSNEVTWYTAERFCEEQGGHLAAISSTEENELVKSIVKANAWIGSNDAAQEGIWAWVTGEPFSYQNWASGEPNNVQLDSDSQNHMQFYVDGTWDDDAGCVRKPFVCEIEGGHLDVNGYLDGNDNGGLGDYGTVDVYINGSLVADDVSDYYTKWPSGTTYEIRDIRLKDGCSYIGIISGSRSGTIGSGTTEVKLGFSKIQTGGMTLAGEKTFNGNTYRFYSNEVTWYTAKRFCEEQGGHLATVSGEEENQLVNSLRGDSRAWIGASDAASNGSWEWVTGESFSYSKWAADEPNNSTDNDEGAENYAEQAYSDGSWNDMPGYLARGFVCEIEAAPAPTLTGISIDSAPSKTVYEIGDKLDATGLKVSAHYSDGTSRALNGGEFSLGGFDSSSDGTKSVTVTYQGKEAAFTVTVNPADPNPDGLRIIVKSVPASGGETADIPVSIRNNAGIAGMSLAVNYDKSILTLEKVIRGELLAEGSFSPLAGDNRVQWYHTANVTGDGVLFTLRFQVSAEAAQGDYAVTLALQDGKPTNLSDENANVVSARFIDGTVTIAEGSLGDLTGDNDIGINDVVKLARAVAGAVTLTESERRLGDITGDGDIGINDVVKLARYVAGVIKNLRDDSAAIMGASEEAVIEVGKVQAQPGDSEIAVPVSIAQNPGVAGLALSIAYDETALTLSKIVKGTVITDEDGELIGTNSSNVSENYLMWYYDGGEIEDAGELFTLLFKINEDAESGVEYPVRLNLKNGKAINFSDMDSNIVPVRFVDGSVMMSKEGADKLEVCGRYIELLTADISLESNRFTVTLTQRDNAPVPETISAWLACYNEHGKMMTVASLPYAPLPDGLRFSGSAATEGNWVLFILDEYFSPVTAKFQLNEKTVS